MDYLLIPKVCPICGGDTQIITNESGVQNLFCTNPQCNGKIINRLDHFCSKKGLDIKGLSKATLEKLIDWGWINNFKDILCLQEHKDKWVKKPGFGEASVTKILLNIELASNPAWLWKVIAAAGIPTIGATASKALATRFNSYEDFRQAIDNKFDFTELDDFGEIACYELLHFDYTELDAIIPYLKIVNNFQKISKKDNAAVKDKKFVITGKLHRLKNRDELKIKIEAAGGTVVGSISKNVDYLINNDVNSTTLKNQNAKKLGIPIITEEKIIDFLENF